MHAIIRIYIAIILIAIRLQALPQSVLVSPKNDPFLEDYRIRENIILEKAHK